MNHNAKERAMFHHMQHGNKHNSKITIPNRDTFNNGLNKLEDQALERALKISKSQEEFNDREYLIREGKIMSMRGYNLNDTGKRNRRTSKLYYKNNLTRPTESDLRNGEFTYHPLHYDKNKRRGTDIIIKGFTSP